MMNRYCNAWFDSLTDQELIDYCRNPPKDCEFNELKIAADVLAIRYRHTVNNQLDRPDNTQGYRLK